MIEFDDKSLDTAQFDIRKCAVSYSRITITDWRDEEEPPRLDSLSETRTLCAEFKRACAAFKVVDKVGPAWDQRFQGG